MNKEELIKEFEEAIEHFILCKEDEEYRKLMGIQCSLDPDYYISHYQGIVEWLKDKVFQEAEIIECGSEDYGTTTILIDGVEYSFFAGNLVRVSGREVV